MVRKVRNISPDAPSRLKMQGDGLGGLVKTRKSKLGLQGKQGLYKGSCEEQLGKN